MRFPVRLLYFSAVAVIVVTLFTGLAVSYLAAKPPALYFIVDARSPSATNIAAIRTQIALALRNRVRLSAANSSYISNVVQVGLRVYGGRPATACPNTRQIVKIGDYPNNGALFSAALNRVRPSGHGSLSVA